MGAAVTVANGFNVNTRHQPLTLWYWKMSNETTTSEMLLFLWMKNDVCNGIILNGFTPPPPFGVDGSFFVCADVLSYIARMFSEF